MPTYYKHYLLLFGTYDGRLKLLSLALGMMGNVGCHHNILTIFQCSHADVSRVRLPSQFNTLACQHLLISNKNRVRPIGRCLVINPSIGQIQSLTRWRC